MSILWFEYWVKCSKAMAIFLQ